MALAPVRALTLAALSRPSFVCVVRCTDAECFELLDARYFSWLFPPVHDAGSPLRPDHLDQLAYRGRAAMARPDLAVAWPADFARLGHSPADGLPALQARLAQPLSPVRRGCRTG